ncbi:hypothetical protein RB195_013368 [Necator americanus]|uniref:Secreted protein n=1 Tax=Necator americanus TaxID=51031 RepID=A0ABR1DV80_NECAM
MTWTAALIWHFLSSRSIAPTRGLSIQSPGIKTGFPILTFTSVLALWVDKESGFGVRRMTTVASTPIMDTMMWTFPSMIRFRSRTQLSSATTTDEMR